MANKKIDTTLFDKAVMFAVKAHSGVERRRHASPYALHVMEASAICETITNDVEILVSALLHDVVEDTEYTIEDIEREFGKRVAYLVGCETDIVVEGKTKAQSWKERKEYALNRLANCTLDAKIVAIGDKLSNIRAISRDYEKEGNDFWNGFNNSNPKDIKWYYTGLVESLKELNNTNAYKEFSSLVDRVFKDI